MRNAWRNGGSGSPRRGPHWVDVTLSRTKIGARSSEAHRIRLPLGWLPTAQSYESSYFRVARQALSIGENYV